MGFGFNPFRIGRLSRRLVGAFFLIVAVLVGTGIVVATGITVRSLEARAESQLISDDSIVHMRLSELEEQVTFYGELLADAETLTEDLGQPSVSRALTISLLGSLRRNRMSVNVYHAPPSRAEPDFELVRRGFLGIRATSLIRGRVSGVWEANVEGVTPIESTAGVERVVVVSAPVTSDYLEEVKQHFASDITLLFPDDHVISTFPAADVALLLEQVAASDLGGAAEQPVLLSTASSRGPARTRVGPLRLGRSRDGWLLLTMPMDDLLAAKRKILFKGVLVTAVVLLGAGFLYFLLIHRVTMSLEELSLATRDIARGNLDLHVTVATRDEVGELAASFNSMVRRLRESREKIEEWNRTLERRVEDRTRSLQRTQSELEGVNQQLVTAMTGLREAQDQMIQAEKLAAVGQMASTIAHEIKNPLAGIRAALEVVVPELDEGEHAEVLEQILGEVDRLGRTSNRLLGFTRPAPPQRKLTSLKELIEGTRFLVGQQARRHGVEIRLELEPPDRRIYLDPQHTSQAFLNIVLNALQAMDGKGTLTIRSRWLPEQEAVTIDFIDTGRGIPPDVQEKIFAPFFTTKRQGTGLGLYVVKGIIERQSGKIAVDSTVGQGTTITVQLPARSGSDAE